MRKNSSPDPTTSATIHSCRQGGFYYRQAILRAVSADALRPIAHALCEEVEVHKETCRKLQLAGDDAWDWLIPVAIDAAPLDTLREICRTLVGVLEGLRSQIREAGYWPPVLYEPVEITAPLLPARFLRDCPTPDGSRGEVS